MYMEMCFTFAEYAMEVGKSERTPDCSLAGFLQPAGNKSGRQVAAAVKVTAKQSHKSQVNYVCMSVSVSHISVLLIIG